MVLPDQGCAAEGVGGGVGGDAAVVVVVVVGDMRVVDGVGHGGGGRFGGEG